MTKRDAANWVRWMQRAVREGKVRPILKSMTHAVGEACPGGHVKLHPNAEILPTFYHECVHVRHPDWSEEEVLAMEEDLVDSITERQAAGLLKLLGCAVCVYQCLAD